MKYLSVCSGIEAATVAWDPLGFEPVAFSEVEPFPSAVLAQHYPDVPNLGDMTQIDGSKYNGSVDLLVGGTPCQSFSVAGLRGGMADPRGNLALAFLGLVDTIRPRYFVWENVPGVLSSSGGRDFGSFVSAVARLGYRGGWRVLDAQYFGLAQRRKRVFFVGCSPTAERSPQSVLFEHESLRGDSPPSREAREGAASYAVRCAQTSSNGWGIQREVTHTLDQTGGPAVAFAQNTRDEVRLIGGDGSHVGALAAEAGMKQQTYIAHAIQERAVSAGSSGPGGKGIQEGIAYTLESRHRPQNVQHGYTVRRLTPIECERLQGFPDDYTRIPWKRKVAEDCPDGPRYKALGNSMAVPVMRWIGEKLRP